jgi:hypothetical protein
LHRAIVPLARRFCSGNCHALSCRQ